MANITDPVTPFYKDYLKRDPDAEGFLFWTNVFYKALNERGLAAAQDVLREGFINSPEYKSLAA